MENLTKSAIHLWYAFPGQIQPSRTSQKNYLEILKPDERDRHKSFSNPRAAKEFLISRVVLRTVLSKYEPIDPKDWSFKKNRYGKPFIENPRPSRLFFSLSHTADLIVVAVARVAELGVDTEKLSPHSDLVQLAEQYFSPAEIDDIKALPSELRLERFYEYWTLKEAYIKARGLGLTLPLKLFTFNIRPGHAKTVRVDFRPSLKDQAQAWQFRLLKPSAQHQLSLAVKIPKQQPVKITEQLIKTLSPSGA